VFLLVVTVSVTEPVAPKVRVTEFMLSDCEGALFEGDTVVVRLTVPTNPMLFRVIVEVAWELRCTDRLVGFADIVKSPVVKTAVWTFSGTGPRPPFAMSTHVVVPATLLEEQPVWNPIGVPDVALVTL
jgi:hypothetical protein